MSCTSESQAAPQTRFHMRVVLSGLRTCAREGSGPWCDDVVEEAVGRASPSSNCKLIGCLNGEVGEGRVAVACRRMV